jgi:hypothetical protein
MIGYAANATSPPDIRLPTGIPTAWRRLHGDDWPDPQARRPIASARRRLENGVVVGRIFKVPAAAPEGRPWMWASGHGGHHIQRAAHGYEATREAAMAAFAKSWRRE